MIWISDLRGFALGVGVVIPPRFAYLPRLHTKGVPHLRLKEKDRQREKVMQDEVRHRKCVLGFSLQNWGSFYGSFFLFIDSLITLYYIYILYCYICYNPDDIPLISINPHKTSITIYYL